MKSRVRVRFINNKKKDTFRQLPPETTTFLNQFNVQNKGYERRATFDTFRPKEYLNPVWPQDMQTCNFPTYEECYVISIPTDDLYILRRH